MTTATLGQTQTIGQKTHTIGFQNAFTRALLYLKEVNKTALISSTFAGIFILYFLVPHHMSFTAPLFTFNVLYIVFAPLLAFILSIWSLRQMKKTHNERGFILSMVSLSITSLYFIVALAIPLVLLGCYIVYAVLLK